MELSPSNYLEERVEKVLAGRPIEVQIAVYTHRDGRVTEGLPRIDLDLYLELWEQEGILMPNPTEIYGREEYISNTTTTGRPSVTVASVKYYADFMVEDVRCGGYFRLTYPVLVTKIAMTVERNT